MNSHEIYYEDCNTPYWHCRLRFPNDWIGTKLPARWQHPIKSTSVDQTRYFVVRLLDTETNLIYDTSSWPHYENYDPKWDDYEDGTTTVYIYKFLEHYCACNRKGDVKDRIEGLDDECTGDRFKVYSITCPTHTGDLVLYSEVMKAHQLELDAKSLVV